LCLTVIKLGWKDLQRTSALAYLVSSFMTKKKKVL
jgi:hypothetical protein